MSTIICRDCKASFIHNARGRPPVKCLACKGEQNKPSTQEIQEVKEMGEVETLTKEIPISPIIQETEKTEKDYMVHVGNFGTSYLGNDKCEAEKVFAHYEKKSAQGYGQVGKEVVTLFHKEEVVKRFDPKESR